ncbi:MAG: hypothetical protein RRB22_01160 [Gammaproteobacteria bacterium]|nr:hypothetical protein [Gammaproteobacteria bacterium]
MDLRLMFVGLFLIAASGCATIQATAPTSINPDVNKPDTVQADGKDGETVRTFSSGVMHYDRRYQAWQTTRINDPLQPSPEIKLCAQFEPNEKNSFYMDPKYTKPKFCFRFYGATLVAVEPFKPFSKGYWPYCDYDYMPYKVDNHKPDTVPVRRPGGGVCSTMLHPSDNAFIRQMLTGETLFVQLHNTRGQVALNGFAAAWEYAQAQFK